MSMTSETRWFAIFPDKAPEQITTSDWKPWVLADSDRELQRRLVINKFIRERGGVDGLREIHLFEHDADAPRHKNGAPLRVTSIVYSVLKD